MKENDRVHTLASTVVAKKEARIINNLARKTEGDHVEGADVDRLMQELQRQDPKGKVDEEEQIITLIERRKKK